MDRPTVSLEHPVQPDVADPLAQADAVAAALYPGEYRRAITAGSLAAPEVSVLLVRAAGTAVGLCAVFDRGDGTTELKRMIVDERSRGTGAGLALLRAAESCAIRLAAHAMLLEVGVRNVAAQRLYRRGGYRACGPSAPYVATPISLFMCRPIGRVSSDGRSA